jgi:hypothetical protein
MVFLAVKEEAFQEFICTKELLVGKNLHQVNQFVY